MKRHARWSVLILNRDIVKSTIVNAGAVGAILIFHNEKPCPHREEVGRICPDVNDSLMYLSMALRSGLEKL